MLSPGMNRFLSLVAFAALIPLLALYGLLMYISLPSPHGGMEPTMAMVCYIALTTIFGALSIVAINFALQLKRQANGKFITP
ncbi:MAG: hypothetical protein ABI120_25485 [Gemmatimonadaceae bacterium]